jgi:hypothetical protein
MPIERIAVICAIASIGACRAGPSRVTTSTTGAAERTVFTDSLMHVERCTAVAPGADWRKECTPKDQGVQIQPKLKTPPPP